MVVKIIVTALLVILVLIVYLIFVPVSFGAWGDMDQKSFKAYLHDPLRIILLRFDSSQEQSFLLRLFFFFRIGGEKKAKKAGKKKKPHKEKKAEKPGQKKKKAMGFVRKKLKSIFRNVISLLRKCHIHLYDCEVEFSTGSPDTTAIAYGAIGTLPFVHGKDISLECDLMSDEPFIHGHLGAKGTIFISLVIYHGIRILFGRD